MEGPSLDVVPILRASGALFARGETAAALEQVETLWRGLPNEKATVPNAYLVVEYAAGMHMQLGQLQEARAWAEQGLAFRERRHDLGEAEFLIGKVEYELGQSVGGHALLKRSQPKVQWPHLAG